MKSLHPARRRFVIGLMLLALTFMGALHEGAVGHNWARLIGYLFGPTGAGVVGVVTLLSGLAFVLPHDAIGRFIRWGSSGREARVERVVRASRQPIVIVEDEDEELAPADRKRLEDVRVALKSLQYRSHEYEPLVAAMDPRAPFEGLIKGALKQLQARN